MRRLAVGLLLIVLAVPVGLAVPTATANGQTVLAVLILAAGAYLALTSTVVDHSARPRRRRRRS